MSLKYEPASEPQACGEEWDAHLSKHLLEDYALGPQVASPRGERESSSDHNQGKRLP